MPAYAPTAKEREIVEKAGQRSKTVSIKSGGPRTGRGIDRETLRSAFREELDRGRAMADLAVANALYNNAVINGNVAAQIWWTKARMRWSETLGHQYLDEHGRCPKSASKLRPRSSDVVNDRRCRLGS